MGFTNQFISDFGAFKCVTKDPSLQEGGGTVLWGTSDLVRHGLRNPWTKWRCSLGKKTRNASLDILNPQYICRYHSKDEDIPSGKLR